MCRLCRLFLNILIIFSSEGDEGHFSWNNLADSEIVCIFAEQYSRDYGKKKVSCGYSDFLATEA